MEAGGYEPAATQQRRRFNPEEYAAAQQRQQAERKDEPEPLYEQEPADKQD